MCVFNSFLQCLRFHRLSSSSKRCANYDSVTATLCIIMIVKIVYNANVVHATAHFFVHQDNNFDGLKFPSVQFSSRIQEAQLQAPALLPLFKFLLEQALIISCTVHVLLFQCNFAIKFSCPMYMLYGWSVV